MADIQKIQKKLGQKYALETDLLHLKLWQKQLAAKLPELKRAKREAETARTEYGFGGIGVFFDKLSGKHEQKLEDLRRAEVLANNALAQVERELQDLERQTAEAKGELQDLCAWLEEHRQDIQQEPDLLEKKRHLDAMLCAKRMLPLLEENRSALEEAAERIRNRELYMDRLENQQEKDRCLSRANDCAKECRCLLEQIRECDILLDIHPYFINPAGYVVTARNYGELDRINSALSVIRETEKQARELILQLTEA